MSEENRIWLITWDERIIGGKVLTGEDLCMAGDKESALKLQTMKNNNLHKTTSSYKIYALGDLLEKYKIKILMEEPKEENKSKGKNALEF